MYQRLKSIVVRIKTKNGGCAGTGFLVAPDLVVTCAHVITGGGNHRGGRVRFQFYGIPTDYEGLVVDDLWSGSAKEGGEDVAFIRFAGSLPAGVRPARLGALAFDHPKSRMFRSLGFPKIAGQNQEAVAEGVIQDEVELSGQQLLQLRSPEIKRGMSGAPVLDLETGLVVGMVKAHLETEAEAYRYAIPTPTLGAICRALLRCFRKRLLQITDTDDWLLLHAGYAEEVLEAYYDYWDHYVNSLAGSMDWL